MHCGLANSKLLRGTAYCGTRFNNILSQNDSSFFRIPFHIAAPPNRKMVFLLRKTPATFWISVCTVDLLMPNALAALRTVAPVSVMYSPNCTARSSGLPFMPQQLPICVCCIYMAASGGLCGQSGEKGRRTVKCEPSAAAAAACHKRPKCNVQPRWYGFWNFKQNMQCFFWKRTKPVLFFIDKKTMIITKHKHRLLPSLLFGKGAPI